jgi:hypothetical protein
MQVWPEPVIITTRHAGFACAGIDLPSATISIITWVMVLFLLLTCDLLGNLMIYDFNAVY